MSAARREPVRVAHRRAVSDAREGTERVVADLAEGGVIFDEVGLLGGLARADHHRVNGGVAEGGDGE